jgi:hypothetical protein
VSGTRPLALSVIGLSTRLPTRERQRRRFELAEAAGEEGYCLLDMFEVGRPEGDAAVYETVAARADRGDVEAIVVSGSVDRDRLDRLAERARLRVVDMPVAG